MPGSLSSGSFWSQWRGQRSRPSRRMHNPPFYIWARIPWTYEGKKSCRKSKKEHPYIFRSLGSFHDLYVFLAFYIVRLFLSIIKVDMSTFGKWRMDGWRCVWSTCMHYQVNHLLGSNIFNPRLRSLNANRPLKILFRVSLFPCTGRSMSLVILCEDRYDMMIPHSLKTHSRVHCIVRAIVLYNSRKDAIITW